jgi:hypothetical protein
MVEMPVREQYARQILKARARLQDLPLRAFAAVDQETIFIMFDDLSGKPAFRGWRRCRCAKKKYFEQRIILEYDVKTRHRSPGLH